MKITETKDETDDLEDVNMNEILTDSEEEYSENERELLKKVRNRQSSESYDSDYEVYGVDEENEEDQEDMEDRVQTDSMESDIEGLQEDFDLPNEKAWGKKKKAYYSTDYVDPDYATISQKDLAEAEMEEEEARNIQKRLAEQLDDVDFELDFLQSKKSNDQKVYEDTEQFIKTDLSRLSKRQKQAMMQNESPEFAALVNDFKDRMIEARDSLAPFLKLVKAGLLPNCPAASFIRTKYHLLLNYCINISFYLMLKAKRLPVSSHPVIKRLAQYRQLLNQLESGQGSIIEEIQGILKVEKQGKPLYNIYDGVKVNINKQKTGHLKEETNYLKKSTSEITNAYSLDSEFEAEDSKFIDEEKGLKNEDDEIKNTDLTNSVIENEGKRAITYQIAKNKGLTPYRKKEQRNPRVKHRNKYRKAKIRRKGAVREVRKEVSRYAGEISGIKASVKKSIKLK
ncbi:Something about silencing protein 10 [Habropoda laboriosa]|uniref:Something about silencing protein 10 n=1 Tax=Habropoda laboriosa TaxID=597456 RepID=A0A0L7RDC9_9HYME|nr:PREDICTED: something about silencing protein 10 [Habropoda laboriosa]KOC68829.1 Something about silencing protein 10 [Habropoda laboriosa]